ncbi:hypothetical protein OG225_43155 (plasmid) [Nocardia sp. NBC_01377]|uniref:hypothetical protein n=1 Tax=Nocardia sp. NBC_01377 TaxID=2903595 RepID=UPI002F91595B
MATNAPEFDRVFANDLGHPFTVRYVPAGSPLVGGRTEDSGAIVEFYDATCIGEPAAEGHPAGQFTTGSYDVATLLGLDGYGSATGALSLYDSAPTWTIDAHTMTDIRAWIAEFGVPSAAKARILQGHPVRHRGRRALRHQERYGAPEAFRPYTTSSGIDCGWYARYGIADCGHEYSNIRADGRADSTIGYSVDALTDRSRCDGCFDERARAALDSLAYRHGCAVGYVSEDARTLTTSTGGELARVIAHRSGGNRHFWRFERDGRRFHGTNAGPGHLVFVRAYKADR